MAFPYGNRDPYNPFVISHSKRSNLLKEKFREFNRTYFEGRLPEYEVLLCSKPKTFGHDVAGYCLSREKRILIRNGLGEKSTLQTLVHEMVHAKLSEFEAMGKERIHGGRFVRELKRLRNLGAPLSPLDVDRNDSRRSGSLLRQAKIKQLVKKAYIVEGVPKERIPRFLERELSLPISVISKEIDLKSMIQDICQRKDSTTIKLPRRNLR